MPRIIVLALTAAALSVLTFQNLATEVPLVILGSTFVEAMPFGLLLLIAVGIGALLTLIFYGLVGSRRPPESKYRPMGRRATAQYRRLTHLIAVLLAVLQPQKITAVLQPSSVSRKATPKHPRSLL